MVLPIERPILMLTTAKDQAGIVHHTAQSGPVFNPSCHRALRRRGGCPSVACRDGQAQSVRCLTQHFFSPVNPVLSIVLGVRAHRLPARTARRCATDRATTTED